MTFESQEEKWLNQKVDYGHLKVGEDVIDDQISTVKAFKVFRNLEQDDSGHVTREAERGGHQDESNLLPSVKIERMKLELIEL